MESAILLKLLSTVNNYWNQYRYQREPAGRDQWATPIEFITKGYGDCEDFAIAKYFMLRDLVPNNRLMLTYGSIHSQPHMVVTYDPGDELLVLDLDYLGFLNRQYFQPIYSFNHDILMVDLPFGRKESPGGQLRMSKWQSLLNRVKTQQEVI